MSEDLFPKEVYLTEIVPQLKMRPMKEDLADFTGLSTAEIDGRAATAMDDMSAAWCAADPEMTDEAVSKIYRETENGYLFTWANADRFRFSKYARLRPYLRGKTLLDYGTATGCMALFAALLDGFQVHAADLDTAYFAFARYRFERYGVGTPINLDKEAVPKSAFDTVLLLDVLEHVVPWRRVLREAAAAVADQGRLIIIVPYGLYDDGSLHISDRTGLDQTAFEAEIAALGMEKVDGDNHIQVFERTN